jgi:very-short-patch-repair endonuclease
MKNKIGSYREKFVAPPDGTPLPRGRGAGGEALNLARELRKHQTPAEQILWEHLRNRHLANLKFRRQHPVEKFIVDFFCYEARLVIEVDGAIHLEKNQAERDALRTEIIQRYGLKVMRVRNSEIEGSIETVLSSIVAEARKCMAGSSSYATKR